MDSVVQLTRTSRNPKQLLPVSNLKEFLVMLHQERDDLYDETASLIIDSDDKNFPKST